MKRRLYISALLLFFLYSSIAFGQKKAAFDFVENKGQWEDSIRYQAQIPGGMLHITDKGFRYYYLSADDMTRIGELKEEGRNVDSEKVHLHNYRVSFIGANETIKYRTDERRSNYMNYFFGRDSSAWRGNIGLFGKVVQQDVYHGIDVAMYSKGQSLKYDFILAPGANPAAIRLKFEGVHPELTPGGHLKIKTSVNEIVEQAPYAYQMIDGREQPVKCLFKLQGNQLTFEFPEGYDQHYTLVIDPELVFTTFSGGGDFGNGYFSFCTTYDSEGCLYAAGVPVWGLWAFPPLWPVTPGAFQTTYSTIYGPMVCLNKYNASGTSLVYSTYYGGGGPNDLPHAMIVNNQGELILAGSTGSFNLPVTTGCFDSAKSGGTDIFIAHFNSTGSDLVGATYVGGNIGNSINGIDMFTTFGLSAGSRNKTSPIELALDRNGNIWAVSNTSTSDFPVTANACQPAIGGGNCDGVLFSLNPGCSQLLYGTFLGGSNSDAAYGIQFNQSGHVVVCGGTKSNNFPTSPGSFMPVAPGTGEWDGFVSIINPISGALVSATYLGTEMDDQAVNLQTDPFDNVYVLGRTLGNYPISSGVYAQPGRDLFIQKLSPSLNNSLLSTRLGNPQSSGNTLFPTAFLVDNCTNVYVTGLSADYLVPLSGMPLTPDAFQTTPGNFWFGVLRPGFSDLLFATYYGRVNDDSQGIVGDHTHVGVNRMDPQGILFQSLCVNSNSYPGTTPQSWSQFNQNTVGQDIVSFKFAFQLAGVTSGFELPQGQSDSGCVPFTVQFENNATMSTEYTWDFGDGSPVSHDPNPSHTYLTEGVFTVSLHAHNDTTCITDDTSYKVITVFDPHVPDITVQDTLICNVSSAVSLAVQVNNPSVHNYFLWQPAAGILGADDQSTITVDPSVSSVYYVTVWDTIPGYCGYATTDTVHVNYKPRVLDILNEDTLVCLGTVIPLSVVGTPGYTYQWSPAAGVQSPSDQSPAITAGQSMTYTVTGSYPGCPDTAQSIRIDVDSPVAVSFTAAPDSICTGQSVQFTPLAEGPVTSLRWEFGDGNRTSGFNEQLQHAYDDHGHMAATLTASFRACPDTSYTDTIKVYAFPLVYLGPDSGICLQGRPLVLQNKAANDPGYYRYLWNTGDTSAALTVVQPGDYSLNLANIHGCSTTETIMVNKDCYIDIPNAFSPNGDGENDYFFPRQLLGKSLSSFHMQIFNRWGQLVFETKNIQGRGWDGRFNGKDQPEGVFIYIIEAGIENRQTEKYQGNVTLVR
jgi:gliding motility-associated-like protein